VKCKKCGLCAKNCPVDAITGDKKELRRIDAEQCIKCGNCLDSCKFNAVNKTTGKQKEFLKKQLPNITR
jgi:NADH-quinone oxidoreductase subunit F